MVILSEQIQAKLRYLEMIEKLKTIKRAIYKSDGEKESDADHCWHLAMMVMVFAPLYPQLDQCKMFKLALIHDLVEIFAGDTVLFDAEAEQTKEERELAAFHTICDNMESSDREEYTTLFHEYENITSDEARFVYELDKFHPLLEVVRNGWRERKEHKMDIDKLRANKNSKISNQFGFADIMGHYFDKAEEAGMVYRE